ncbi:MAG: DUF4406 domain-containing protein [Acutalibacteraceae bacterium]
MDKFNSEGYSDLTTYYALSKIEKEEKAARKAANFRPLVYICSPYNGDIEGNTKKAKEYSRFAVDHGAIPLAPHLLLPQFMSEHTERELAMFMNMVFLGRCEQIWVFGNKISNGMAAEIKKAKQKNIKIRYFTDDLKEKA